MAAEAEASREARAKVSRSHKHPSLSPPVSATPTTPASTCSSAPIQGDRGRGRDESVAGAEGGLSGDRRVSVGPAAALPSDPQHHRRREELHHHLPAAFRLNAKLPKTLRDRDIFHKHTRTCRPHEPQTRRLKTPPSGLIGLSYGKIYSPIANKVTLYLAHFSRCARVL